MKTVWNLIGILYMITFYAAAYVLRLIARILLAIAYFFMIEPRKTKDILKNLR